MATSPCAVAPPSAYNARGGGQHRARALRTQTFNRANPVVEQALDNPGVVLAGMQSGLPVLANCFSSYRRPPRASASNVRLCILVARSTWETYSLTVFSEIPSSQDIW